MRRPTQLVGASARVLREVHGGRIGFVFQDPGTSLNPLLTVERQITESLETHRKMTRRQATHRALELHRGGRAARAADAAELLPPSAVRRPAAARDDRDRTGVRPRTADRRRADHIARRHDAGADHRAGARSAARLRHRGGVDQPRPRGHRPGGRRRDRAAGRRSRGAGADPRRVRQPAAALHPGAVEMPVHSSGRPVRPACRRRRTGAATGRRTRRALPGDHAGRQVDRSCGEGLELSDSARHDAGAGRRIGLGQVDRRRRTDRSRQAGRR